jgi:hypothetical protein
MENDPTMSTANSLLSAAAIAATTTGLVENRERQCEQKQHERFQIVATKLAAEKKNNEGWLPHKAMIEAIASLALVGIQTTKSVLQSV